MQFESSEKGQWVASIMKKCNKKKVVATIF